MHRANGLLVVILATLCFLPPLLAEEDDPRPWEAQPFLGLSLRDTPQGLVVGWVSPGPLGGRGFESEAGIQRGDNVVSINGRTVDAATYKALVKGMSPGDEVTIVYRRSPEANPEASVPTGGTGGEETTLVATLGSRAAWAGTIGRGLGGRTIPAPAEGAYEAEILAAAARVGAREGGDHGGGLDALLAHLATVQEEALDPNALPAVVQAFRRPLSVDAVEGGIADLARAAATGDASAIDALLRGVLDLPDPEATIREVMEKPGTELTPQEVRSMVRFCGQHLEGYQTGKRWRRDLEDLIRTMRESVYIYDDKADQHVRTINEVAGSGVEVLLQLPFALLRLAPKAWETHAETLAGGEVLAEVPEAVREAVAGDVLAVLEDPLGNLAVVGGRGPNRYDMSRVAAVYDLGGDDHYDYPETPAYAAIALRIVIDLGGDDVHESQSAFEGPATAVMGFSLLDDRGGDDVYRTTHAFGVAAGAFGVGILIDRGGHDVYEAVGEASGWGLGVGFYGAGLLLDLDGHDVYRGEKYVQGVGGPRGFGAILDVKGNDRYVANGPHFGSAYGTPAVSVGMSQGFGMGVRGYAAGGVGAIYDLDGHDRYEAGEFSQAGGYYFGLGILHDAAGHDLYYGNRYGQAFSAHQAVGILVDDAGDDTYWSMTAASQAGTWDESIGLLLDRGGNDAYRCDGLGQGGASMQAIALLIDVDGSDRYTGAGRSIQGQGGGNSYHYDQTKCFSFSALLDLGADEDTYSAERTNDTEIATGVWNEGKPENSSLHGIFVDR